NSITNLIVVDYEDNVIDFDPGSTPNEIVLKTPAVSNARISYSTQDLVDKTQGRWIFSLDSSSISIAVKMPPDSVLIDPGENFPAIRLVGDQQLLTFKPGDVRFVYVIGVLGTEEQANIVIRVAQTTIAETTGKYSGIILTNATDLIQKAIEARDDEKFSDAESLAGQANDAAEATGRDYEAAQSAITDAEEQIRLATSEGRDTSTAGGLLQTAKAEFESGNYVPSKDSADNAVTSIGDRPEGPQMPLFVIVAAVVAAGGGVGAMLFLRSRKPALAVARNAARQNAPANPAVESDSKDRPMASITDAADEAAPEVPFTPSPIERGIEQPLDLPATLPDSQIDKSILSRIVGKIVEEKPHLRPEDQDVLRYLAEKEGAAFESEIRTKFQLPKTTIWRLVKRLEREELVEIRKAGGQNLIKLKFENRKP
ncbi:MAG: helix-turn-helix transcriptional regulator, partial [Nitrososphaera sp.]